ncbi:MAG TPA: FtsX-like permease family protein [Sporichthyaceae bacterium]|nr:FtsX-like permease family protein [Sporichthyaceae bacterium]
MSARIATLRLARREILRHEWRSLLIVLLILIPVAAGTCFDIVWRTSNSRQALEEQVFGGADAIVGRRIGQSHQYATDAPILAALPPGTRAVGQSINDGITLSAPGHQTYSYLLVTDHLDDPLLRNRAQLASGRAPVAADEAAITPGVAHRLGLLSHGALRPGATIAYAAPRGLLPGPVPVNSGNRPTVSTLPGPTAPSKVVGLIREPFCLDCSLTVIPSASRIDSAETRTRADRFLLQLPPQYRGPHGRPLTALSALGVPVTRRDDRQIRQLLPLDSPGPSRAHLEAVATGILVGGVGLLEIVLLAGTAFAVGARRQARELGLLAGQGASPRDLRRVVLAQGLLLAGLASAGGIAIGFGADRALRGIIEEQTNQVVIGTHFGWIELGLAAAVAFFSGLAAAALPAFAASRRPVTDALRERFAVTARRSRWRPLVGTVLVTVAALAAWAASAHARSIGVCYYRGEADGRLLPEAASCPQLPDHVHDTVSIVTAVFIGVAGLLMLMPAALAAVSRIARRLPATPRMAARDTARQCHRTGPATVAISVAVCGAVSLACLIDSGHEKPGEHLFATSPPHTLSLSVIVEFGEDPATLATAIAAAVAQLPGARVIPIAGATGGPHNYNGVVVNPSPDGTQAGVAVGTPDLVLLASGRTADRAVVTAALNSGKALVFDPSRTRRNREPQRAESARATGEGSHGLGPGAAPDQTEGLQRPAQCLRECCGISRSRLGCVRRARGRHRLSGRIGIACICRPASGPSRLERIRIRARRRSDFRSSVAGRIGRRFCPGRPGGRAGLRGSVCGRRPTRPGNPCGDRRSPGPAKATRRRTGATAGPARNARRSGPRVRIGVRRPSRCDVERPDVGSLAGSTDDHCRRSGARRADRGPRVSSPPEPDPSCRLSRCADCQSDHHGASRLTIHPSGSRTKRSRSCSRDARPCQNSIQSGATR